MKQLFKALEKDYLKENFSTQECVIFGIIVPAFFILMLVFLSIIHAKVTTGTI